MLVGFDTHLTHHDRSAVRRRLLRPLSASSSSPNLAPIPRSQASPTWSAPGGYFCRALGSARPVGHDPKRHNLHASLRQKSSSGMGECVRRHNPDGIDAMAAEDCELCRPENLLLEGSLAYVRYDNNSLSPGHVLLVPRRHVASYFDMTGEEKAEIQSLLDRAQTKIAADHSPDGYNIGVNIGRAAGQNRMHVHVHLIPRYSGDVRNPSGGIRCVLSKK
jgi:diadenosine tetraphosphate (Ap4A) HIT family hydrolase